MRKFRKISCDAKIQRNFLRCENLKKKSYDAKTKRNLF